MSVWAFAAVGPLPTPLMTAMSGLRCAVYDRFGSRHRAILRAEVCARHGFRMQRGVCARSSLTLPAQMCSGEAPGSRGVMKCVELLPKEMARCHSEFHTTSGTNGDNVGVGGNAQR